MSCGNSSGSYDGINKHGAVVLYKDDTDNKWKEAPFIEMDAGDLTVNKRDATLIRDKVIKEKKTTVQYGDFSASSEHYLANSDGTLHPSLAFLEDAYRKSKTVAFRWVNWSNDKEDKCHYQEFCVEISGYNIIVSGDGEEVDITGTLQGEKSYQYGIDPTSIGYINVELKPVTFKDVDAPTSSITATIANAAIDNTTGIITFDYDIKTVGVVGYDTFEYEVLDDSDAPLSPVVKSSPFTKLSATGETIALNPTDASGTYKVKLSAIVPTTPVMVAVESPDLTYTKP